MIKPRTAIFSIILVAVFSLVSQIPVSSGHHLSSTGISLSIHFANGTILSYEHLEGTTVLNVTESVVEVDVEWYGNLAYVESIAGVHEDDGGYWQYWVNDELGPVAANMYQLENGDSIDWKQPSLTETTPPNSFDNALIVTIGATCLLGIGFLLIIYLRVRR